MGLDSTFQRTNHPRLYGLANVATGQGKANFLMMRGFNMYAPLPNSCELYRWPACAVAAYAIR